MTSDNFLVTDGGKRHGLKYSRCASTSSECSWIETESDSDRIYCDGISKAAITALAD